MRKRKVASGESIYVFKITLSDWEGRVQGRPYRIIACPEKISLFQLGETIVESFDFSFDHAFGFYDNIKKWYRSQEGYELFADIGEKDHFPGVKRTKIAKVFSQVKKKMLFLFDYGDEWRFVVQFMKTEEPEDDVKYPVVTKAVGEVSQYEEDEDWEDEKDWKEDGEEKFAEIEKIAEVKEIVPEKPEKTLKTGRNDPCPCGSGKKYKKCCGIQEDKVVSLVEFQTEKAFDELMEKLCSFIMAKYLDAFIEAFADFDVEFSDPEEFADDPDASLVFESFVFDMKLSDGKTPFEEFIEKNGQGYRTITLQWFEELRESVFALYEVTGMVAGEKIVVKNMLTDGIFDVYYEEYFDEIRVGDAIWCRLLTFRQGYRVFLGSIIVLPEVKEELRKLVLREHEKEKHLPLPSFLKEHSLFLLEKIIDYLENPDLEDLPEDMYFRDSEQAQLLIDRAMASKNKKKKIELAEEALELDHLCVGAYVILAEEEAETWEEVEELLQQGVRAGEKVLGKSFFEQNRGHFWGLSSTRPYMKAKLGLAGSLWQLGERREAVQHLTEMLELNPEDHQGVRYILGHFLLTLDEEDAYQGLMEKYSDDLSVEFLYNNALFLFKRNSKGKEASDRLKNALEYNGYVAKYLLNILKVPKKMSKWTFPGGKEEAAYYVLHARSNWEKTPGALQWLSKNLWLV